ncbi:MAG: acylphosphatase [Candidatus Methanoperedens sp.]
MKQMMFIVSGNVQKAGYRDRVIELGKFVNLTGYAENMPDGNVRIVAEGEEEQLDFFRKHIDIKNTLIRVDKIEYTESEATNKFNGFLKLVSNDETDARLDTAAKLMKELIDSVRSGFKETVGAIISVKEDTSNMKSTLTRIEFDVRDTRFSLSSLHDNTLRILTILIK